MALKCLKQLGILRSMHWGNKSDILCFYPVMNGLGLRLMLTGKSDNYPTKGHFDKYILEKSTFTSTSLQENSNFTNVLFVKCFPLPSIVLSKGKFFFPTNNLFWEKKAPFYYKKI